MAYRNVHDTGAVSQTPGRKTGTTSGRPNPHTDTGYSHATKTTKTHTSGNNGGKKTTTTTTGKKPAFVPSFAYNIYKGVTKYSHDHNLKKRTKFAQDEGLFRDWAKTHQFDSKNPTLDVMSSKGKDYLKEAGYGPFQEKTTTGGGDGAGQRCPDGTMPPCPPATPKTTVTPTATTPQSSWQLYPQGSDYTTGQGYDTGGGVRTGPPPKRGPNPQVPPVLFSRGGGAAIRGTKFKGVK
jgi:hypothetical protein